MLGVEFKNKVKSKNVGPSANKPSNLDSPGRLGLVNKVSYWKLWAKAQINL